MNWSLLLIYGRYSNNNNYLKWQLLHGRSFVFAGFNIANVLNTFSSSYAIGYHFIHSPDGGGYTNGHFIGIGIKIIIAQNTQLMIIYMC